MKGSPSATLSPLWQGTVPLLCVALLAFAVFANTLSCGFVWDDRAAILTNRDIRTDDNTTAVGDLFVHDFWGTPISSASSHKSFRPITVLTFRLNYAVGGFDPWGYHLLNVVLHSITSALVVVVGRRVMSIAPSSSQVHRAPVLAGLLFAVHPIHCDSVASVVGRADVLCTLVSLVAFTCYDTAISDRTTTKWMHFILSIGLIVLATLCKELGATTLGMLVVLDLLQSYRLSTQELLASPTLGRLAVLVAFGTTAIAGRILLNGPHMLYPWTEMENDISLLPFGTSKVLTIAHTHAWYLYKMAWPQYLSYDYGFRTIPIVHSMLDPRNISTAIAYTCVVTLVFASAWHSRTSPSLLLMASFALFPFVPAANVLFPVGTIVAERLLYFPSVGVCLLAGYTLDTALHRGSQRQQVALVGIATTLLIVATARTLCRNRDWTDEVALFEASVKVAPWSTKVLSNLSKVLLNSDAPRAAAYLERALHVLPHYSIGHFNLGLAYVNMGKSLHCMDSLLKAIDVDHSLASYSYLGKYLFEFYATNQHDKFRTDQPTHALATATKLLDFTLSHHHNLPTIVFTRGLIAYYADDFAAALPYFERTLEENARVRRRGYDLEELVAPCSVYNMYALAAQNAGDNVRAGLIFISFLHMTHDVSYFVMQYRESP
ncbi:hypothetical protein, variant 1 [Aphanomyces astaci]|uniref:dolichyl-phosphate-mannose--protein mannosyltransferase n=1 Tax=Aphanomyces astaci TaxID=112090 RepID=W4GVS1_APHAT|nr:hypothetical protein, variant 1 [Aphanomyces astaci]ETV83013.1 hypothetical protein, variant 1 [Aphanomyces astaci]|eukprot:XP_009827686.1 hypothetical protein, variant 1 [Aphanomyces astaci]